MNPPGPYKTNGSKDDMNIVVDITTGKKKGTDVIGEYYTSKVTNTRALTPIKILEYTIHLFNYIKSHKCKGINSNTNIGVYYTFL